MLCKLFLCFGLEFCIILDEFFWITKGHYIKNLLFCILCVITTIVVNVVVIAQNKNNIIYFFSSQHTLLQIDLYIIT